MFQKKCSSTGVSTQGNSEIVFSTNQPSNTTNKTQHNQNTNTRTQTWGEEDDELELEEDELEEDEDELDELDVLNEDNGAAVGVGVGFVVCDSRFRWGSSSSSRFRLRAVPFPASLFKISPPPSSSIVDRINRQKQELW